MIHKVKIDNVPKTNKKYISISYEYIGSIDNYRFLFFGLEELVKNLAEDDFENLKKEFPDKAEDLIEKMAYP